MLDIGCKGYKEWKAEKEQLGEKVVDYTLGEGLDRANIGTAVSIVSQFLSDYDNAIFSRSYLEDRGWQVDWIERSQKLYPERENNEHNVPTKDNDKTTETHSQFGGTVGHRSLSAPYYQIAKQALMEWNGLSLEEAKETISNESFDEIEAKVGAKPSIEHAIERIEELGIYEADFMRDIVYKGRKPDLLANEMPYFDASSMMDVLFAVHDGWVEDHPDKFMARDKKFQHMPSELIGWEETKKDLLFVKPIFEALGSKVDEQELQDEYNRRVKEFFLENGIVEEHTLAHKIAQGPKFYPALANYPKEALDCITNISWALTNVIPSIEEKGIGNIANTRFNILTDQISENPTAEDLKRLEPFEVRIIDEKLDIDISFLTGKRDLLEESNAKANEILSQKQEAIESILIKAQHCKDLKEQIKEQEKIWESNNHTACGE